MMICECLAAFNSLIDDIIIKILENIHHLIENEILHKTTCNIPFILLTSPNSQLDTVKRRSPKSKNGLINIANEFHLLIIYLESDIKHLQSAKSQINEFSDKSGVNRDTLTNYPSYQSDMQVQEGEVKYRSGPSASYHQMSSERNTAGAVTRSQRKNTTKKSFYQPLRKVKHQALTDLKDYPMEIVTNDNDDDDEANSSREDGLDDICDSKEDEECYLSYKDGLKKKKKEKVLMRRAQKNCGR
jgi:hypothetical protein